MPLLRGCSSLVIRCFKRVEHCADWFTGAAGPVFVFLAWTLIGSGGFIFFDTVARDFSLISSILLLPVLILVPLNLYGQYYLVTHVPPGYPSARALAKSDAPLGTAREEVYIRSGEDSVWRPERWGMRARISTGGTESGRGWMGKGKGRAKVDAEGDDLLSGGARRTRGTDKKRVRRCRKCDAPKPERTHHCSVCRRCVLLMDHHCPWINACVGLHNQRHFILFMSWLCMACYTFALLGWNKFWASLGFERDWDRFWTPRIAYTLLYIIAIAIVNVLLIWHLYMISNGETSIESHDNVYLDNKAAAEGLIYLNPYDLGRRRNVLAFFNLYDPASSSMSSNTPRGYPLSTLLLPLVVPPASDGWSYQRRVMPEDGSAKRAAPLRHGHGHGHGHEHGPGSAEGAFAAESAGSTSGARGGRGETETEQEQGTGMVPHRAEEGRGDGSRYLVLGDDEELTDDEEGGGGWMEVQREERAGGGVGGGEWRRVVDGM